MDKENLEEYRNNYKKVLLEEFEYFDLFSHKMDLLIDLHGK